MTSIIRGDDDFDSEGIVDGAAKAWVNFNGTGTVAIRDSFNVDSITDNGVGDYTVNFTSNMANANYAVTASGNALDSNSSTNNDGQASPHAYTISSFGLTNQNGGAGKVDAAILNAQVFGDQ